MTLMLLLHCMIVDPYECLRWSDSNNNVVVIVQCCDYDTCTVFKLFFWPFGQHFVVSHNKQLTRQKQVICLKNDLRMNTTSSMYILHTYHTHCEYTCNSDIIHFFIGCDLAWSTFVQPLLLVNVADEMSLYQSMW